MRRLFRSLASVVAVTACTACAPLAADQSIAGGRHIATGRASFYHEPQRLACEPGRFQPDGLTAAHRSLPCGSIVRVRAPASGKEVVVRINDRGPFIRGRILDLSRGAARQLDMIGRGVERVELFLLPKRESPFRP